MLGNSSKFKKTLLSSAAIALIGAAGVMGAPKNADAAALAYSALTVTGLQANIFDPGTGLTSGIGSLGTGGFLNFQFTLAGLFVQLTGSAPQFSPGSNVPNTTTPNAVLTQTQLCLVDCTGFTDDAYLSGAVGPGSATAIAPLGINYAVADNNMNNTLLNGSGTFGVQAGASSLGGGTLGSGDTGVGSSMNWNFETDGDDAGKVFSLDWVEDRLTQIQTTLAGESAEIQLDFRITLQDVTPGGGGPEVELFNLDSDLFTSGAADPTVTPDEDLNDIGIAISSVDFILAANTEYELVFNFGAFAQASSPAVPEPGTIGLLGIGLLGLGALRYRRRRKQAA